jgi:glycine betaine catabolism B
MGNTSIRTVFNSKEEIVEGVKRFIFDPEEKISYKAGQFAFFDFTLEGKEYAKHFTISNAPENKEIELTTMIRDSEYKKALDSLEKGHEVFIRGIDGDFTLEEGKALVFLAGGIGITPVKSMLEHAADSSSGIKAKLLYSNRKENAISYKEHLNGLKEKLQDLDIIHTLTDLSGEEEKNAWNGETGYIDAHMVNRHIDDPGKYIFYVSGPPAFNRSMIKMLQEELNVRKDNIKIEDFSGY